jgi:hypothetical protein
MTAPGMARVVDPHTIETRANQRLHADKIIICTGGVNRRLAVPGFELTSTSNRTGRSPASGSRTRPHAFTHGKPRPSAVRRTSPKCP